MSLENTPFRTTKLEEEREDSFKVVSIKFNKQDYEHLQELKKRIEQPKDSTAIKTLIELGEQVILDPKTNIIIDALFKNKRNNKRTGLSEF